MAHYKGAASEGNRAAQLMKRREKAKEELERLKQKISEVCTTIQLKEEREKEDRGTDANTFYVFICRIMH